MPRVRLNRKKYMVKDLSEFIVGRMMTLGLTQAQMGKEINISQPAFGHRLQNSLFSYEELLVLFKKLNATDEAVVMKNHNQIIRISDMMWSFFLIIML